MYLQIVVNKLLTLTHCTYTELFIKKTSMITFNPNVEVIFNKFEKVLQYDAEKSVRNLRYQNKEWIKIFQIILDKRKKQLNS